MSHFIEKYAEYCQEFTDSPKIFHYRIALSILSSVINRKVYMRQGHRMIFPNLWLIVVAPSSFYRKSYSLSIAEEILRTLGSEVEEKFILPREFSHEKFVEILADQPSGLLVFYEFKTFMAMLSRDYMAGTQSLLTELYDCPEVYDRKTKVGNYEIKKPFLNILSATTIDWLVNSVKDADIAGGFLPRFLIVAAKGKKENILSLQPACNIIKKDNLVAVLFKIYNITGEARLTPNAQKFYHDWYVRFETQWSHNPSLSPFYARLQEYTKKLAMLIAIDETLTLSIEEAHVRSACNMADSFANEITELVSEDFGGDRNQLKVVSAIKQSGFHGIGRKELIRKTRLIADRQLDPILRSLIESDQINVTTEPIESDKRDRAYKRIIYSWILQNQNGNHAG